MQNGRVCGTEWQSLQYSQRLGVYIAELHSLAEWQSLGRGVLESGQSGRVAEFEVQSGRV